MNKFASLFSCFMLILFLLFSCRSSKKIQSAMTKKDTVVTIVHPAVNDSARIVRQTLQKIYSSRIEYNSFTAKVKVDYQDSRQRRYDFNAFVRMQKDSVIWISINAALGIEAFRVLITKDSIKILDKLDKFVQYRSMEYLRELSQLPLDLYKLQDLLVGNPLFLDSSRVTSYRETSETISLATRGEFFKHLLTLGRSDSLIGHSKLDDVNETRNRTADLTYGKYERSGGRMFPTSREIIVAEKSRLEVELDFKQVEFNKDQGYPFQVPRSYKRK